MGDSSWIAILASGSHTSTYIYGATWLKERVLGVGRATGSARASGIARSGCTAPRREGGTERDSQRAFLFGYCFKLIEKGKDVFFFFFLHVAVTHAVLYQRRTRGFRAIAICLLQCHSFIFGLEPVR